MGKVQCNDPNFFAKCAIEADRRRRESLKRHHYLGLGFEHAEEVDELRKRIKENENG